MSSNPRPATTPTARPSRREFVCQAAAATAGLTLAGCLPDVGGEWLLEREGCQLPEPLVSTGTPVVAEVYDARSVVVDAATQASHIDTSVVPDMADSLLRSLAGQEGYWPALLPDFVAGQRIGLKVNCLNPQCQTTVALVRALVDSLKTQLGVTHQEVIVWDRRLDELTRSGFTAESVGAQVMGTVASTTDPSGPGYESATCAVVNGKSTRLSRILTELTDVTINVPVLKTHAVSGVTAALKNIYGVIDNPGDFHSDLNDALPALYALAPIQTRFRLTIVDAFIAVTVGGTSSPPDTVARRLFAGTDPVAVDSYALALVNQLRAEKQIGLLDVDTRFTAWLPKAEAVGLGRVTYELRNITRAR